MTSTQVPSATRTLRVLRYLSDRSSPASIEAIARACDLPRSTAYHLLNTMIDEGFVSHDVAGHRFGLGLAAFETGAAWMGQHPVVATAGDTLAELSDRWRATAMLALLVRRDVVVVREVRGPSMPPLSPGPVPRRPAETCPAGLALLAASSCSVVRRLYADSGSLGVRHGARVTSLDELEVSLERIRGRGYAACRNTPLAGLSGVAAAARTPTGAPFAVLLVHREGVGSPEQLGPEVVRAADALAQGCGPGGEQGTLGEPAATSRQSGLDVPAPQRSIIRAIASG